jgi:hypothetical protein
MAMILETCKVYIANVFDQVFRWKRCSKSSRWTDRCKDWTVSDRKITPQARFAMISFLALGLLRVNYI